MHHHKFDPAHLDRLEDPERFLTLPPSVLWSAAAVAAPRTIVDLGAGTGLYAAAFSAFAPSATILAVDIDDAMLDWLRTHRTEVAQNRVVPVKAEEAAVPLGDGVADLVVLLNLHHEFVDPGRSYAEAVRLLHPGGRLLTSDWAPGESPKGPPPSVRVPVEAVVNLLRGLALTDVHVHEGLLPHHWLVTATA
jgi:SAM-dependent methyltransferase